MGAGGNRSRATRGFRVVGRGSNRRRAEGESARDVRWFIEESIAFGRTEDEEEAVVTINKKMRFIIFAASNKNAHELLIGDHREATDDGTSIGAFPQSVSRYTANSSTDR